MPEPPLLSASEAIRVFERFGWQVARQESSHISLKKPGAHFALTIPNRREVPRGTLRQLIGKAGLTVDEFTAAWKAL
jgi:predicted RNA binding protein YcfA (HicA-like mRNA interferase family)